MKANLVISVIIDGKDVSTTFGTKEIEGMDPALMAQLLKVFGDTQKKTKATVERYYGTEETTDGQEGRPEETQAGDEDRQPAEEKENGTV
ncbi:MAG: hypothetical protein IJ628_08175 [Bacteroidaceae bacterium]|nr:hypothetical protein [Bacteroidaceae bacterium]